MKKLVITKTSDGTLIHDKELEGILKELSEAELPASAEELDSILKEVKDNIDERENGTAEQRATVALIEHFNVTLFPTIADTHTYNKVGNNRIDKLYIDYAFPEDGDRITLSINIIQKGETKQIRKLMCDVTQVPDLIYKEIAQWIRVGLNDYIKKATVIDDQAFI